MKLIRGMLSGLSVALCVAILLLLLIDCIRPNLDLFLRAPVKGFLLAACLVVIASSAIRLADQRRKLRKRLARRRKASKPE